MNNGATFCGIIALILFCWGSLLVVLCLRHVPPFQLGFSILLIGYAAFSLLEIARGKSVVKPWKQDWESYAGALSGIGLYTVLMYMAFRLGSPFEINVLNYLWPILVVAFSMMAGKTAPSLYQFGGLSLGFCGMLLLFLSPDAAAGFRLEIGLAHILALLGASVWAGYCVWAIGKNYPSAFMGPVMLLSSLLCLAAHTLLEETLIPGSLAGIGLIVLLGLFRVSYILWDYAMRQGDTVLLSSLSYFVPLGSTLLMVGFGFRPEHGGIALGGALIILGCLVVNASKIARLFTRRVAEAEVAPP